MMLATVALALAHPVVDTVVHTPMGYVGPEVSLGFAQLAWYVDEQPQVVMASYAVTWTATRTAITSQPTPYGTDLNGAFGYRRDRTEGPHDTLLGKSDDGNGSLIDLLDPTVPPYISGYSYVGRAGDVDGDGTVDILTYSDEVIRMAWP